MKSPQGSYMKSPTQSWSGKFCLVRQALQIHYTIPLKLLCTTFWIKGTDKSLIVQSTIVFFYFLIFVQNFRWWRAQSSCIQRPFNIDLTRSPLPIFLFQFFWLHNRQGLCCVGFGWSWFAYLDLIENLFNANFVSYTTGKGWVVLGLVETGLHIWMWLIKISLMPILLATQQERVQVCWVWLMLASTFGCDWIEFLECQFC